MMDTMFFVIAKVVGALIRTETWIALSLGLVVLALVMNWHGVARIVALIALGFFLALSILPIGDLVLRSLERTYPAFPDLTEIDGIIVLSGGPGPSAWPKPGAEQCADRYTSAAHLARQFPDAKLLVSGGSGRLRDLIGKRATNYSYIERIFVSRGLSPDRLLLDHRSRNTAENARMSLELARPGDGETWALITSAFHMRRAVKSFEKAGWDGIVPYPVDYRSVRFDVALGWNPARNIRILDLAIKELIGQLAYDLLGR